jgi:hypothetical protein
LNTILSDFEPEIDQSSRADMGADLAIVFARFRSDHRQRQLQIRPNELREELKQIERNAAKLAKLLHAKPEAADAMARATHLRLDVPNLTAAPAAPPIFQRKAVDIEMAAKRTLANLPKHMPYVDSHRDDVALNSLVERLLRIWETYAGEAPTFQGDKHDHASSFVRFGLACCRHLELRIGASAFSKRAARLYAVLPGPKVPKQPTSRGRTRRSTGHVVRRKRE